MVQKKPTLENKYHHKISTSQPTSHHHHHHHHYHHHHHHHHHQTRRYCLHSTIIILYHHHTIKRGPFILTEIAEKGKRVVITGLSKFSKSLKSEGELGIRF